jgi:lipopolysaccharide assembly protein A
MERPMAAGTTSEGDPATIRRRLPTREGCITMTQPAAPQGTARNVPPPSANGSAPSPAAQPAPDASVPQTPGRGLPHTRISGVRSGLIAGIFALILVVIFISQNAHAVNVSFLGAHLRLSLAVALFLAAIAGALVMAAAGTARITQLRRIMRRDRHRARAS